MKALRLAVAVLVTNFFVPCFTILLAPFSCASMRTYYGADYGCDLGTLVSMSAVAAFAIAVLVPLGLASALAFRDSDPTSANVGARRSGIVVLGGLATQIVIIVLRHASAVPTTAFLAVMTALHFFLALMLARTLPFYRPAMNRFRVRCRGAVRRNARAWRRA